MSKMNSHDPFGHLKKQVMAKRKVDCQIDSRPLKVNNCLDFLTCRWGATYYWKALNKGYTFALNLISIRSLQTKLWSSNVTKIRTMGISRLPFRSLGTKWHLGVGPVARHRIYYKEEGGGFPQIRTMVNLVNLCLPVARPCTKMLQLRTNKLVV